MANARERWAALGAGAKVSIVTGLLVVVVLLIAGAAWILRDDYQVLFADLDPQDGAAIVAELDRMKVGYRLADSGRTILVERDAVHKTRLKIMGGKGVPLKGNVGFEIFNNSDFGMTEFAQKINYQRALQGELARTIMSIEEIRQARVHLAFPEGGLLKKNSAQPKASVTLALRGDSRLRPEQIVGIQRLVAAAVPDMDPQAVTVLDHQGVALSRLADERDDMGGVGGRLELKKSTEVYLTKKAIEVLDRAFGPGQAIVSIDVTLSQDSVKTTREDVIPFARKDGEFAGAVTRRRTNVQGVATPRGYEVQATADLAKQTPQPVGTQTSSVEVEYENGKQVEQVVTTPGSIKRISVGVVLPGRMDAQRIQRVSDVVAMAVGLQRQRGDASAVHAVDELGARSVSGLPAALPEPAPSEEPPQARAVARDAGPKSVDLSVPIAAALAMLLAVALALFVAASRRRPEPPTMTAEDREKALSQIRAWVQGGEPTPTQETRS
ncbi:MAG TPA: flagellar basal-body MS-ring/collar protein FliF [Burkholderiales bacterium]